MLTKDRIGVALASVAAIVGLVLVFSFHEPEGDADDGPSTSQVQPGSVPDDDDQPAVPGQPAAPGQDQDDDDQPAVPGQPAAPGQPVAPAPGQPAQPGQPAPPAGDADGDDDDG